LILAHRWCPSDGIASPIFRMALLPVQYADESNPGGRLSENLENLVTQHDFSRHLIVGKTEPVEIRLISPVLIGEPCLQPISKPIK
jgi:hypothetical protein